jgi:hypothetical protein
MIPPLVVEALSAISPLHAATLANKFTFVMNGIAVEADVADAAALSPAVALQLSVDSCARRLVVDEVDSDAISHLKGVLSGAGSGVSGSAVVGRSLSFLFGRLRNAVLELAVLFASGCTFVPFVSDSLSLLSLEALDLVLSEWNFSVTTADSLFETITNLGAVSFPLLRHVRWYELSGDLLSILSGAGWGAPEESVWSELSLLPQLFRLPPPAAFPSLIVADFPPLFAEFTRKHFTLLWRGSRDGFGARDFHSRCDGHANTLTLILDTRGNIFGGFTPVEWESRNYDCSKADPSLKSFVFTLKNPRNTPARQFALMAQYQDKAICCDSSCGPCFGCRCDIAVLDNCNANNESCSGRFGDSYMNDTGQEGRTFLTGSSRFTVKEIEVFEITN